jgi:hypothetical protein
MRGGVVANFHGAVQRTHRMMTSASKCLPLNNAGRFRSMNTQVLRFGLSFRNLEEMMAERNLTVDHVTIRALGAL